MVPLYDAVERLKNKIVLIIHHQTHTQNLHPALQHSSHHRTQKNVLSHCQHQQRSQLVFSVIFLSGKRTRNLTLEIDKN